MLVGVCASGKTTLSLLLKERGILARAIAQEHSGVADLYKRNGQFVVILVASWQTVHRRRELSWDRNFYLTEWHRLERAREDASLIIHTDLLGANAVAEGIVRWYDRKTQLVDDWELHPEWTEQDRAAWRQRQWGR